MKIKGIYKIINKIDKKYYVGSSVNIKDYSCNRWQRHKYDLKNNNHHNIKLQRAWNKYGEDAFEFIVVEQCEKENLMSVEQKYLDIAKQEKSKTYNLSFVSENGGILTTEHRKKISETIKNLWKKSSYSNNRNTNKGKKIHSETNKKLFRDLMKGKISKTYDKNIYKFYNVQLKIEFVGLRKDFIKEYNLLNCKVSSLISKKSKHHRGWIVIF